MTALDNGPNDMTPITKLINRLSILAAVGLLAFSGCMASSDSPEVTLEKANILKDRGKFDDAVPVYTKAIESFSDRPDVYFSRGDCYFNLQLPEKALADYTKCLELDPDFSDAINEKGVVLAQMGQFELAAEQFSLLINKLPDNVLALRNRGLCLHDLGNYEEALRDYEKAIELNDKDPETWFQKGNVLRKQKQLEQAIADYDKAIQLAPDFAKAWMQRGVAKFKMGNKQQAMAELMHASELDDMIIIPDIDWVESASGADVVMVAKPVFANKFSDWPSAESFAKSFLLQQGFGEITTTRSFAEQKCAEFQATRDNMVYNIYVGAHQDKQSSSVSLPAIEADVPLLKTALLTLKWTNVGNDDGAKLEVATFDEEWDYSTADYKAVTIEVSL